MIVRKQRALSDLTEGQVTSVPVMLLRVVALQFFKVISYFHSHLIGQPSVCDFSVGHDECKIVGKNFFGVNDVSGISSNLTLEICGFG